MARATRREASQLNFRGLEEFEGFQGLGGLGLLGSHRHRSEGVWGFRF